MKILFFRLGAIGDTLLTTPAVRKARELFPGAVIHYLAGEAAAEALKNNPYIDKIIPLKKTKTRLPRDFQALAYASFVKRELGGQSYDYFIDFESSPFSAVLSLLIRAKIKIGHIIRRKRKFLYNLLYNRRVDHKDGEFYVIHRHLALLKAIAPFENTDNSLVLKLTEEEFAAGRKFYTAAGLEAGKPVIMFSLSSTWKTKQWPDENWIKLGRIINERIPGAQILLLWAPGEAETVSRVAAGIGGVVVIPETGLREMAAIMAQGDVLVANDGAARHVGVALGLKTVGLFGPTTEKGWALEDERTALLRAPRNECEPCHRAECRTGKYCMHKIGPESVYAAIAGLTEK
ncbi:MAG TPA: glycosyltransferase family 9 protein [Candidatus Goldiibacteriota bacterium]|nr:glycosyltransferase family 9 protein [Candidatus Goldiibacteriota bacterium]